MGEQVRTKVLRQGSGLVIRIPAALAKKAKLDAGSVVDITLSDGNILVRPIAHECDLASMLDAITSLNLHDPVDTGEPQGREGW